MKATKLFLTITAAIIMATSCDNGGEEPIPVVVKDLLTAENFPDAALYNYIKMRTMTTHDANGNGFISDDEEPWDADGDGKLSAAEAAAVTGMIDVPDKGIASLAGIEYFTGLTELVCSGNKLTSLDVSKNAALTWLYCQNNNLTSLDVSKNTALTQLWCNHNALTSLDVSKNAALTRLWCFDNAITSLDLSKNAALTELDCDGNINLASLDVSGCTELLMLKCDNSSLTSLDVSDCTKLNICLFSGIATETSPGSGVWKFPVAAWFDGHENRPAGTNFPKNWIYVYDENEKLVTVVYTDVVP